MSLQLTLDNTTLMEAIIWRDLHPAAYQKIIEWAHRDARLYGRCFMQAYLEALRSPAIAEQLGLRRAGEKLSRQLAAGNVQGVRHPRPLPATATGSSIQSAPPEYRAND